MQTERQLSWSKAAKTVWLTKKVKSDLVLRFPLLTWLSDSTPSWVEGEVALEPLIPPSPLRPVSLTASLLCCLLLSRCPSLLSPLVGSWSSTVSSKLLALSSNLLTLTEGLWINLSLRPFSSACSAVSLPFSFNLSHDLCRSKYFGLVFSLRPSLSLSSSLELLSLLLARLTIWLSVDCNSSSRKSPGSKQWRGCWDAESKG